MTKDWKFDESKLPTRTELNTLSLQEFLLPKDLRGIHFEFETRGKLDNGMAPLLRVLYPKFRTRASCSGHGKDRGYIEFSRKIFSSKDRQTIEKRLSGKGASNFTWETDTPSTENSEVYFDLPRVKK